MNTHGTVSQPALPRQRRSRVAAAVMVLMVGCGTATVDEPPAYRSRAASSMSPLLFEARGRDFKWQFLSLGPDGEIGTGDEQSLGNELVVPSNASVTLFLTSEDYVYTLDVPDGRIAVAVPEMVHTIQFVSPAEGTYEFHTDPLCGLRYFHDDLLGTLRVTSSFAGGSLANLR